MPSLRLARACFAAAVYRNTLFVFGGLNPASGGTIPTTSVEALNLDDPRAWQPRAPMPVGIKYGAAALYRDKIWQCGGNPSLRGCRVYDPESNAWAAGTARVRLLPSSGFATLARLL